MSRIFIVLRSLASIAVLCCLTPFLIGCGQALYPTAPAMNSFATAGIMSGHVHGGNQPVSNSTVQLYAAGTTGYGSAGTLYATTTSLADGYGSFSFIQTTPATPPTGPISPTTNTYACPTGSTTNSNPQMYLIAKGGNTQGTGSGANSAAAFAVALGPCSGIGSLFVDINEVTSVGTMAALQQYFNPVNESFGYPNTTQATLGFGNGVNTIANLVNIATGAAVTSTTHPATPLGASNSVTVTATPEVNMINLVANILAVCVNTTSNTSSGCATLFADAVPPTAAFTSQPTQTFTSITASTEDTLQALYFMMTDPTSGGAPTGSGTNMLALFNSASTQPPFLPVYATAPTDWTIAINYTSTSTCTLKTGAGTTSTNKFLNGVNNPNVDANGDIWWATTASAGGLYQISPIGVPLSCGLGTVAGATSGLTIDSAGYIWTTSSTLASSNYHAYKWNPSTGLLDTTWPLSTTNIPEAVTADGSGDIFYTATPSNATFSTTTGSVNELEGAGVAGASVITPTQIAVVYSSPLFTQVDSSGRVWTAITQVGTPTSQALFDTYPSNNTSGTTYLAAASSFTVGATTYTGYESANVEDTYTYSPYGLAVSATTIDTGNGAGSGSSGYSYDWEFFTPGSTPGTATTTHTGRSVGGLVSPRAIAVDGAGNVFGASNTAATGNYVTGATSSGLFCVAAVSSTGVAIAATSTPSYGDNSGGFQKPATMLPVGPRGVAVDPTGNVWIGQNSSTATSVMELVGVGVPLVTPLSTAAGNGALGTMP